MLNDLSALKTHSTFYQYADDLIAGFCVDSSMNVYDLLENDVKMLTDFYTNNHLNINYNKSTFMALGICPQGLKDVLIAKSIKECECLRYLGFLIDSELKMVTQVDKICAALASGINALRFLIQNLVNHALMKFFHAHIQANINYCSFALLRCRSIDIDRIQRLQSKALKVIFDLPDSYDNSDLFAKEAKNILCVIGLIYNNALVMIRKCVNCIDNSLPYIQQARSVRKKDLIICKASKKVLSDDLTHVGCKLYNELPMEIKSEKNMFLYKQMLKKFVVSRNCSLVKSGQFSNKSFFL